MSRSCGDQVHSFDPVEDQIQDNLLKLDWVAIDDWQIIGELGLQRDLIPLNLSIDQCDSRKYGFVNVHGTFFRSRALRESADLREDVAGPVGVSRQDAQMARFASSKLGG